MHLLNLELVNWSCHSSLNLDLSNGLQIEGRNGSGKTSILEAIRFIFAESALGYKNKIRNGERSAKVSLSFTKDRNKYVVDKELFLDKPSTARMLCNDTLVGDNPTSVYNSMQNILDENILDKLLYIPQGGLTSIVESLSRKEGRKELDSLFGLEKFDRIYKESAEDIKESKMKLDFTLEQIAKHPKEASRQYTEEIRNLEDERGGLEGAIKTYGDEVGKLDGEIKKADAGVKNLEDMKRKRDKLQEELRTLEVELAKSTAELDNVKQRLDKMSKMTVDFNNLVKKDSEIRKYPEIRELLVKLDKLRDRQASMRIDKDRERLMVIENELTPKPDVEKRYSESENAIKETEALKAAFEHDLKQQESYLRELEDLEGKAKCPRCGQTLTPEHLNNEKALNEQTIKKLGDEVAVITEKLTKELNDNKQLKEKLSKLEKIEAEEKYIKAELEKKSEEEKVLSEAIMQLKKKLYEAGYQDESLIFVGEKVDEYNKTRGELELLREELKQKEELGEKQKKLTETLSRTTLHRNEKDKMLGQFRYSEDDLERLRQDKEELTKKKYAIENEANKKQFRINEIKTRENEVRKELEEYEKLKSTKESQETEIKLLTQAREIFHTDKGIQKYLRDRYINQLNNLLTYYFKRINENPRYNEIVFDKSYEIQIKTTEGLMTMEQLSGGEKIQLAITLRIALTEMLSHTRLLILDEPFGSLDRNHREILGETLSKIASNGQLIVVTHIHVDSLQLERIELEGY